MGRWLTARRWMPMALDSGRQWSPAQCDKGRALGISGTVKPGLAR
jgi:hypothetical protein